MAEAVFRLPFYTMAVLIANARTASGDKSEGATHEYYVTADVVSKHIQKASPNVNVINPTHKPEPPRKRELPKGHTPPPAKPKTTPAPEKPKPKPDSTKFPVTTGRKKSDDPQGKILSAEFVDNNGNRLHSSKVGTTVRIKIVAKEMKNKKVTVKIWEEDNFKWTHDKIFEKDYILIGDNNYINNVQLTKKMFDKANDGGSDSSRQDYFIEVIDNNTSVGSSVIPVSADAELTRVESGNSATAVGKTKLEKKKEEKVCECEARVRAYMRMLRVGEGTGELIKSQKLNKKTKKVEIIYISHDFESGYTKLFGGGDFTKSPHNKDISNHPNIKVLWYTKKNGEKVYSSASGAYQVMGYTWYDKDMINKRKTYNIKDFSPEGQDKFCVVLFKHKREGMLDLIIKGEIKEATEKYGSYEWASLPPGRYGQPIETMEKAIELYNKFYQEELSGKSPLHLKKRIFKRIWL